MEGQRGRKESKEKRRRISNGMFGCGRTRSAKDCICIVCVRDVVGLGLEYSVAEPATLT